MKNKLIFRVLGALASALIIVSVFVPFVRVTGYSFSLWGSSMETNSLYLPIMIIVFGVIGVIFFALNIKTEFAYMSTGAIIFFLVVQTVDILNQGVFNTLSIGYYCLIVGSVLTGIMAFLMNLRGKQNVKTVSNDGPFESQQPSILAQIDGLYGSQNEQNNLSTMQPIQPMPSVDMNQPIQPIEPVPPVDMNQSIQPIPSVDMNQPIQPIPSVDMNQPIQQVPSVDMNQPIEPVQPVDMNQSIQPIPSVDMNQPIQPVSPVDMNQPIQPVPPVDMNQPIQQVPPVDMNQPIVPLELDKPQVNPVLEQFNQLNTTSPVQDFSTLNQQPVQSTVETEQSNNAIQGFITPSPSSSNESNLNTSSQVVQNSGGVDIFGQPINK